jgi:diguanylate cyclase (GGDEF)-like protein
MMAFFRNNYRVILLLGGVIVLLVLLYQDIHQEYQGNEATKAQQDITLVADELHRAIMAGTQSTSFLAEALDKSSATTFEALAEQFLISHPMYTGIGVFSTEGVLQWETVKDVNQQVSWPANVPVSMMDNQMVGFRIAQREHVLVLQMPIENLLVQTRFNVHSERYVLRDQFGAVVAGNAALDDNPLSAKVSMVSGMEDWQLERSAPQPSFFILHKSFILAVLLTIAALLFARLYRYDRDGGQVNQMLYKLAYIDSLTNIPNRRAFDNALKREWARAKRHQETLSLVMLDIDHFKKFNDTYGHKTGDQCLQKIAEVLRKEAKRESDVVARYGGEEFVIILPNTPLAGARYIAEALCQQVAALAIPHGNTIVTVSCGIAAGTPKEVSSMDHLFQCVDEALYRAKNTGRNRVEA